VEARAPGKPVLRRDVTLASGAAQTVTMPFEVPYVRRVPRAAYVLGGVGLGLLAAETTIGLVGMSRAASADRDGAEAWNAFAGYGLTTMFVVGLAGVGAGVALYLRAPLVPVFPDDGRGAGVAVSGRF
jgi:hypothetical protein